MTQIDKNRDIQVKSNFRGHLHYISKKTSLTQEWEDFDDVAWMTIDDLAEMRSTQKDFFEKNYIVIDEEDADEIYKALRVDRFYKNLCVGEDFEKLVKSKPVTIKKIVGTMTDGNKEVLIAEVANAIKTGTLDSVKVIETFEEMLGENFRELLN